MAVVAKKQNIFALLLCFDTGGESVYLVDGHHRFAGARTAVHPDAATAVFQQAEELGERGCLRIHHFGIGVQILRVLNGLH